MPQARDSRARYRVLADTSTDIILNLNVDGTIRFVSPSIRRLGDYDPADLIGQNANSLIAPEHVDIVRAAHLRTLTSRGEPVPLSISASCVRANRRWFERPTRGPSSSTAASTGPSA
ncbi:PAS domain S-box protein [Sphingomonas sp. MMS24-JH45]